MTERPRNLIDHINAFIDRIKAEFANAEGEGMLARIFNMLIGEVTEETTQEAGELAQEINENSETPEGTLENTFIIGDSIVEGISSHAPNAEGYRGQRTERIMEKLAEFLAEPHPEINNIVIFAGVNNVWHNEEAIPSAVADIESMAQMVAQAGKNPVLCTIHNMANEPSENLERITLLNEEIRQLAQNRGYRLIDFAESNFQAQSLHPSSSGYAQMTGIIAGELA